MDDELEKIKKKRLKELQQQNQFEEQLEDQNLQEEEFEKQKKMVLISIMTPEARERLGNIKLARPQIAESIEHQLIMLAQSGRLKNKINDKQLQQLLKRIIPKKRDINIRRR